MARIAGVNIPTAKRIEIALTYIFGIGRKTAQDICAKSGVKPDVRVQDMSEEDIAKVREVIDHDYLVEGELRRDVGANIDEHYMVEGDLRRETALNIKRLQEIGCYRGIRHRKSLPVRGQKTKTNARTRKGPRKTVANKKK